jgi:catechol 2,3-dioxygenase-like lactoylglutathione lyase family enzyme
VSTLGGVRPPNCGVMRHDRRH